MSVSIHSSHSARLSSRNRSTTLFRAPSMPPVPQRIEIGPPRAIRPSPPRSLTIMPTKLRCQEWLTSLLCTYPTATAPRGSDILDLLAEAAGAPPKVDVDAELAGVVAQLLQFGVG